MHILISALSRFTQPTGICRYAVNLARCLSDLREIGNVTLLVGQWQEEYFNSAFGTGSKKIDIIPIAIANSSLARNRWFAFGLPKAVRTHNPDIVHVGFPVPIFRSRFSCPVVVTVHDLYPYDMPENFRWLNGFCRRAFIRQSLRACNGVACDSESTRRALERKFPWLSPQVPVHLVHNYADFPSSCEAPSFDSDPRPYLLAVAQHQPNKRLDLLIMAFSQLRNDKRIREKPQLLVVGSEGARSDVLRALVASLNLDAYVKWLSQLSDRQLAWMYQNCEAFVTCSTIEGFCLPLLEALVFNCRVVASDIPVFHEIAGSAPVYFDISRDPVENLTAAILSALNASPRANRQVVPFSRNRTAAECMALYSLLVPERVEEECDVIKSAAVS